MRRRTVLKSVAAASAVGYGVDGIATDDPSAPGGYGESGYGTCEYEADGRKRRREI